MSSNPFDVEDLLGAYALDALDDDERRAVDDYLLANPRARAEVQEHREVATMLAWSGMDAPDGLWDRIADRLEGSENNPESELGHVLAMRGSTRRREPMRIIGSWALGTAAAALIAIVAVRVSTDDTSTTNRSAGIGSEVEDAISNPQSVEAELTSASGLKVRAVIDPDGHGYLLASSLPPLDASRTYQLWGQLEGQDTLISLGLLGSSPKTEPFTVKGRLSLLAITEEVQGGVVSSSNPAVVAGVPA